MRIPDGLYSSELIIIGWVTYIIILLILTVKRKNYEVLDYSKMGLLVSLEIILQLANIPFLGFPVTIGLTGIPAAILILGIFRGILVSLVSIFITSLLIPGFLGSVGVQGMNLIITTIIWVVPLRTLLLRVKPRKLKSLLVFITAVGFIYSQFLIILVELYLSNLQIDSSILLILLIWISLAALLEGVLSIVAFNLFYTSKETKLRFQENKLLLQSLPSFSKDNPPLSDNLTEDKHLISRKLKIIMTFTILITLGVSTTILQASLLFVLSLPLYFLYRPKSFFVKRIVYSLPIITLVTFTFYLSLNNLGLTMTLGLRYLTSITHSSILLDSEGSVNELLSGILELKLPNTLLLVVLFANKIIFDQIEWFSETKKAAKVRGINLGFSLKSRDYRVFYHQYLLFKNLFLQSNDYFRKISLAIQLRGISHPEYTYNSSYTVTEIIFITVTCLICLILLSTRFWNL